jgi:hypothetical protein
MMARRQQLMALRRAPDIIPAYSWCVFEVPFFLSLVPRSVTCPWSTDHGHVWGHNRLEVEDKAGPHARTGCCG